MAYYPRRLLSQLAPAESPDYRNDYFKISNFQGRLSEEYDLLVWQVSTSDS